MANIIARRHSLQQEALQQLTDPAVDETADTKQQAPGQAEPTSYRLSAPEIIDADKVMMDKLMAFLEARISDPTLRMEDMADEVNLSRTAFYSKMRSIVGMPPVEFVRHIRLQRAELLVAKSKDSFSQIEMLPQGHGHDAFGIPKAEEARECWGFVSYVSHGVGKNGVTSFLKHRQE